MRPFDQALAHGQEGKCQRQRRGQGTGALAATGSIRERSDEQNHQRLADHDSRKASQPIKQRRPGVEQPGAVEVGRVGKGERKEVVMDECARAQKQLAAGQAKEQIGLLHRSEAQPGHEHQQPSKGHRSVTSWTSTG